MIEYIVLAGLKYNDLNQYNIESKPIVQAESALLYNKQTQEISYAKNVYKKQYIASLTKLMTAYIILNENQLNESVYITLKASNTEGSTMNLKNGDILNVHQLLEGLLINSGNDAAVALAIHNSGSVEKFVHKMNLYKNILGLYDTNFQNPMGFDHPKNFSTAKDLLTLSQKLLRFDIIQTITNTNEKTIYSKRGNKYFLKNTNQELHNFLDVNGLKTGKTPLAKECFIGNNQNNISIVLNSNNRFLDTKNLLDWKKN